MKWEVIQRADEGKPRGLLSKRMGAALALGGVAVALVAITAATAPASRAHPIATPAAHPVQPPSAAAPAPTQQESGLDAQRFTGRIGDDLSKSLLAAGVPEAHGRGYVAVLGRAIQLTSGLSVDDRFDLVIERKPDGTLGQLLFVGLDRIARADVSLLKWTDGKSLIWVNADGVGGEESSRMGLPVRGRVTSGFGTRFHPILGYARFHKGLDLAARSGTPIVAAADGRVVSAGWHGGYGQQIEIAHAGGLETTYGHMSRMAARAGELVRKGQVIGYVGSTGLSTGPHLHFEVMRNGRSVNPATAKLGSGLGHLEGEKLHQFQGALRGVLLGSATAG